jgi:outer membrane protein TolC
MVNKQRITLLLMTLLVVGGCRGPHGLDKLIFAEQPAVLPSAPLVSLQASAADTAKDGVVRLAASPAVPDLNAVALSLDEAISLGLSRNPDLAAVRASEPVAIAAIGVANTYIYNPQFQTQVLPYNRDRNGADGAVSQQHVVVQTIELGGQQRHREGMAAANWRQVHSTVNQAELMNMAQTTRLYFAALYQRELRDLSSSLASMNEQLIGVIERREKAGQSNKADLELTKLQYRASLRQLRLTEAGYQTALAALRTQLNFAANAPLDLTGKWAGWRWRPMEDAAGLPQSATDTDVIAFDAYTASTSIDDSVLRQLVVNRPDVVAARSAVAMAAENMRLADAMRCPNLQAGPMYQRDEASGVFWGVQAQIDIPVVNTGKPLVQQRMAELRLQQVTATQLENRAILEARAAIQRYERARRLVAQSRDEFNRDLSKALKPFEDQFKAGQITLLQVFAARTTLIQSQQSFFDLLNELTLATADVTQATGLPPQMLIIMMESLPKPESETQPELPPPVKAKANSSDEKPTDANSEATSREELLQP